MKPNDVDVQFFVHFYTLCLCVRLAGNQEITHFVLHVHVGTGTAGFQVSRLQYMTCTLYPLETVQGVLHVESDYHALSSKKQ